MPQLISIGTAPSDDGTGLNITVMIKEVDNTVVIYSGWHPAKVPAVAVRALHGFMFERTDEPTYTVKRVFQDPRCATQVLHTGLTLAEAQAHCADPETSSKTATSAEHVALTNQLGAWFDVFDKE